MLIDLKKAKQVYLEQDGPNHIKTIADHYGVFEHLFGDAYFIPRVPLNIVFETDNLRLPVYYGNTIKPKEANSEPEVHYAADDNTLWTLILTNPDGHFTENNAEYVHWFMYVFAFDRVSNF